MTKTRIRLTNEALMGLMKICGPTWNGRIFCSNKPFDADDELFKGSVIAINQFRPGYVIQMNRACGGGPGILKNWSRQPAHSRLNVVMMEYEAGRPENVRTRFSFDAAGKLLKMHHGGLIASAYIGNPKSDASDVVFDPESANSFLHADFAKERIKCLEEKLEGSAICHLPSNHPAALFFGIDARGQSWSRSR